MVLHLARLSFQQERWNHVALVEVHKCPACFTRTIDAQYHWQTGWGPGSDAQMGLMTDGAECRQSSIQALSLNWLMVLMAEIQGQSTEMTVFVLYCMSAIKTMGPLPFCFNSNLINFELKQIVSLTTWGTFWVWLIGISQMTSPPLDYSLQMTPKKPMKCHPKWHVAAKYFDMYGAFSYPCPM